MLVKIRFANIINIVANDEILPELLQSKCNSKNIFNTVDKLLNNKEALEKQIFSSQNVVNTFKTKRPSELVSSVLINHL